MQLTTCRTQCYSLLSFHGEMQVLLCQVRVQRCRKKGGKKNVLGDGAEASSDDDHSSGNDGDENEDRDDEEVE
jgi:hypothetical protein